MFPSSNTEHHFVHKKPMHVKGHTVRLSSSESALTIISFWSQLKRMKQLYNMPLSIERCLYKRTVNYFFGYIFPKFWVLWNKPFTPAWKPRVAFLSNNVVRCGQQAAILWLISASDFKFSDFLLWLSAVTHLCKHPFVFPHTLLASCPFCLF